jgi:5'-deoxynucleotidase YfbR-like HD superfamily hydrolase
MRTKKDYKFDSCLMTLGNVRRWGSYPLLKSESDADHEVQMVALALINLPKVNKERLARNLPLIDIKEVVYRCVIHDLDECTNGCGDIPRPIKHYDEKINHEINRVMKALLSKELEPELVDEILNAKNNCIEGTWVSILDLIQAGCKILTEKQLGNSIFAKEIKGNIYYLSELKKDLIDDEFIVEREFIDEFINYVTLNYEENLNPSTPS